MALVFLNVLAVIVGTVREVRESYGLVLEAFEVVSVVLFTAEYLARVWSCVSQPEYARPVAGRLRFMLRPMALVDLAAILPFYLAFIPIDMRFVRALRLFRILRLAKVGRYSASLQLLGRVFTNKKEQLVIVGLVMGVLVVLASSFMYFAEHEAQPEKFADIPTAMWWSIVTLTTVGYGDVYPVTAIGRLLAAVIATLGIGMFALPAGIIGASFMEELDRSQRKNECCPHCGKELKG